MRADRPVSPGYVKISPSTPDPLAENKKAGFLAHWRVVKRARFNAAKRLERKHRASTMAFVIAAIIGFLSLPFELLFDNSLEPLTKRIVQFSAYVTGVLSLTLGLIEQARNYPSRARHFDQCAKRVNSIVRDLETTPMRCVEELKPFVKQYEAALEEFEENHDDLDYDIAKATDALTMDRGAGRKSHQRKLKWLRTVENVHIYGIHGSTWVLPIVIGLIIWLALGTGSGPNVQLPASQKPKSPAVTLPILPNPQVTTGSSSKNEQQLAPNISVDLPFSR